MVSGIRGNNPGRIPCTLSPFRGEVKQDSHSKVEEPPWYGTRYSNEYKPKRDKIVFEAVEWGYRAMFLMLRNYSLLYGFNTLTSLIKRWGKSRHINYLKRYIGTLSKRLGIPRNGYVDTEDPMVMIPFVSIMVQIELGVTPELEELLVAWDLLSNQQRNASFS